MLSCCALQSYVLYLALHTRWMKCWHSATLQVKPESILPIQTQPSSICTFPRPVQFQRNHVWSCGKICSMYIYIYIYKIIKIQSSQWIAPCWLPASTSGAPVLDGDRSCGLWAPLAQQVSNKPPQEVLSENDEEDHIKWFIVIHKWTLTNLRYVTYVALYTVVR